MRQSLCVLRSKEFQRYVLHFTSLSRSYLVYEAENFSATTTRIQVNACVAIVDGDPKPEAIGFSEWKIPRGKYVYEKINDWNRNIKLIGPTFERMIQENNMIIDWSRPMLEFYKSLNELRLLVPVTS